MMPAMQRANAMRWLGVWLLWGLAAMLAGCTTISLVPPYDEQIDRGLTTLYAETSSFVDRMISNAGTPAGTYANNVDFYDRAIGGVDALIVRAEAHRVLNDCPTTAVVGRAFDRINLPADVRGQIGTLPTDDCQVVLLRLVRDNYRDMRDLHQLRGERGFPPEARAQLLDGGIGAMLRAAITVEIAKRATRED